MIKRLIEHLNQRHADGDWCIKILGTLHQEAGILQDIFNKDYTYRPGMYDPQ